MPYLIDSQKSLLNLALNYCSRRETSRGRLDLYLRRKCREAKLVEATYGGWIQNVLNECERLKIVDDHRYAGILIREYSARGKGKRYIEQKLKEKRINPDAQKFSVDEQVELERAVALGEKTLNQLINRKKMDTATIKRKILQKLISAGFSFSVGKIVLQKIELP